MLHGSTCYMVVHVTWWYLLHRSTSPPFSAKSEPNCSSNRGPFLPPPHGTQYDYDVMKQEAPDVGKRSTTPSAADRPRSPCSPITMPTC